MRLPQKVRARIASAIEIAGIIAAAVFGFFVLIAACLIPLAIVGVIFGVPLAIAVFLVRLGIGN